MRATCNGVAGAEVGDRGGGGREGGGWERGGEKPRHLQILARSHIHTSNLQPVPADTNMLASVAASGPWLSPSKCPASPCLTPIFTHAHAFPPPFLALPPLPTLNIPCLDGMCLSLTRVASMLFGWIS